MTGWGRACRPRFDSLRLMALQESLWLINYCSSPEDDIEQALIMLMAHPVHPNMALDAVPLDKVWSSCMVEAERPSNWTWHESSGTCLCSSEALRWHTANHVFLRTERIVNSYIQVDTDFWAIFFKCHVCGACAQHAMLNLIRTVQNVYHY